MTMPFPYLGRAGSRSKIQLDQIEEAMRLMNFGQELHEDTRRELCQMVERQTLPKGAILMEYCEPIEVIIVVTGSLDLIVPTTPPDAASSLAPFSPQQGKMVASIGRGGRLGDTSAAQGVHLSASLVRAGEACEVLLMDAADFKRIIHHGDQRRLLSRMGVLMQLPLFQGEPPASLQSMAGAAREAHFQERQVVVRQGQEPEDLFIICRGSIRCIREVPALRSTVQQIVRPLKSAPGWLLDDEDLLDEQGISIAVAPPVSSRKEQTFSEMLRPQLFPAESAASVSQPAKPSSPAALSSQLGHLTAHKPPLARQKEGQTQHIPPANMLSSFDHPSQLTHANAAEGLERASAKGPSRSKPKRQLSRQTLSIPEEQAHTQPYAHEQLAMLHEEDEVAVSAPVRGTKLITSAERPGRDAPPPTPAANLYSPPGTGKAKQGQAPPPTPAYLDTTSASTNAVPQKSPRGKASKILSVKRRQCPINSVLHAQIPASTGSATLPIQQQLTPGTGGSTARRANSLFVEVAKLGRLDSFGEAAFVKSSPQPATAMAVLSTDVLIISKHQILKHGSPDLLQRLSKAAQLASMSGEMVSQAFITSAQWHEYKDQLVKQVAAEKQLERAVHPICAWEFFRKPFRSPMISGKLNTHPWQ
ncbi:hypothetical protein WJX74_006109 [Apatococcus lobatus]|uniref:Cyclic nucleotide-binding domain-containing protein n=1 Tax=Apatococcus lobatus TaxID=904363 RepID=A0AAW1RWT7_9CHLO